MANVALPIESRNKIPMSTTLPIFKGGAATSPILPVSIGDLIQAEKESLSDAEIAYQQKNGTNSIPTSFDSAERFCNILVNPPAAGQFSQEYEDAVREYIGLLAIFACRNLLGLNITAKQIDMSENVPSGLLRGLGTQLAQHGGSRVLTYFCIDNKAFAYIYKKCLVPIKDRGRYKTALISVPFYNGAEGRFDDILSATVNDAASGKLLFKQLIYAFLYSTNGMFNSNGAFLQSLGAPYLKVTEKVKNSIFGVQPLGFIQTGVPAGNTLYDVLMNAPVCPVLPQVLFSDNLLLLLQNNHYKPPCFGEVQYDDELYNVVSPMSKQLCDTLSDPRSGIRLVDDSGAPDCSGSTPDEDGCVTCRFRLSVTGVQITVQRKYSLKDNCKMTDANGVPLESINMGIDCNINPCDSIQSIFRRYIVWNGPECVSITFPQELGTFPVTHLSDNALVAVVEPNMEIPKFAYLSHYGSYCGCIKFPEPINYTNTQGTNPSSVYLDFGTTNTICLVECGGAPPTCVDIKGCTQMVTGDKGNADFRIYHLLSERESTDIVRSMAICSVKDNKFGSSLYRAHALNAGKDALDMSINEILRQREGASQRGKKEEALDLTKVNVYDNLKWTSDNLANEGYRAVVGSIFSSAFAKLMQEGYNPNYTSIIISVPSSMNETELDLTQNRVRQALQGIRANVRISQVYYESTAAAFYIINDPNSGVQIGNSLNVGVDIGGGSIDLFSFRSKIGHGGKPIPACIDSVKNAAGRKIISETFVKAVRHYYATKTDPDPDSNPFFSCFLSDSAPNPKLNSASDSAAICITETFIPDARFDENAIGESRVILNTFRRNVLLKLLAVLNYAAEFVKASWNKDDNGNDMDFSNSEVNIILCGNGSSVLREEWSGVSGADQRNLIEFLKSRIGCKTLNIMRSGQPKKETVVGMKYIEKNRIETSRGNNNGERNLDNFALPDIPTSLDGESTTAVQKYVDDLMEEIIKKGFLHVSGDVDSLHAFHNLLKREVNSSRVRSALDYVLRYDDVSKKGDGMFLADVFLRIMLELPFIDPYNN